LYFGAWSFAIDNPWTGGVDPFPVQFDPGGYIIQSL
jgi:hypothetical protein